MKSRKKQQLAIDMIGPFFVERKKVFTQSEYSSLAKQPIMGSHIRVIFGGYPQMLSLLEKSKYWSEINKPVPKAPTPATKKPAAVKPAIAAKLGKDDE
jgi:hypothetical protein